MKKWIMKRVLPMLLSIAVIMSTVSIPAQAVGNPENTKQENILCEHHQKHTADCGYTAPLPCTHEHSRGCYSITEKCVHIHTTECYPDDATDENSASDSGATPSDAKSREPENCSHVCSKESGCITEKLNCRHDHDGKCGYVPATPCHYVCAECQKAGTTQDKENTGILSVQAMIDALPGVEEVKAMSLDGQRNVYDRLQEAYDAYEALSGEEKEQIISSEILEELFFWFNNQTAPTAEKDSGDFSGFHWSLDEDGTLTITGTGNMPYAGDALWHQYEYDIVEVVITDGITSIGESAFENCRSLTLIKLPNSVVSIGDFAFYGCENLSLTELPDNVNSIGRWAFNDCINLALTRLPDGITSIKNYAFSGCISLALTELPAGITSIVICVFESCYPL